MNPQKNKASPKRPQFFLPGLLKVALLPGHWCGDLIWRPKGPETTNESAERLRPILAEPCIRQCRVGGWVSNETAGLGQG